MADYTELIKALREEACNPFSHIEDARLMCRAADAIEELSKCLDGVCADNDNLTQKLIELNQKCIDASNEMQRQMCRADGGKWVSVNDWTPDFGEPVLTVDKDYQYIEIRYIELDSEGECHWEDNNRYWDEFDEVVYWMPLPKMPEPSEERQDV